MILIISNQQDLTADFVVRELTTRQVPFARLNTDEFPLNCFATASFSNGSDPSTVITWKNRPRPLDFSAVRAVWYRRPVPPVVDASISDPGAKQFAIDESYEFLRGVWYGLDCFWMSHPNAIRRAEHKIVQLKSAMSCGFNLPRTVVTNDQADVANLLSLCP